MELHKRYLTESRDTECAWEPASGKLVVINTRGAERETVIGLEAGGQTVRVEPYGMAVLDGALNGK